MSSWLSVVFFERITSSNPSIPQQRLVTWQISAPDLDVKFRVCVIAVTDFPGDVMLWCCEATVLIKRVGMSLTRRVISAGIKAQMSSRSAQAKSEALTVIGVELADREDWRLSPSPPPRSEVTSSSPLCSQAENCPFWRWAASALWHKAQNAAVHHLLHPSAAQRYLQPPAVDLTLLLLPPAVAAHCSGVISQVLMRWRLEGERSWRTKMLGVISPRLISLTNSKKQMRSPPLILEAWRICEDAFFCTCRHGAAVMERRRNHTSLLLLDLPTEHAENSLTWLHFVGVDFHFSASTSLSFSFHHSCLHHCGARRFVRDVELLSAATCWSSDCFTSSLMSTYTFGLLVWKFRTRGTSKPCNLQFCQCCNFYFRLLLGGSPASRVFIYQKSKLDIMWKHQKSTLQYCHSLNTEIFDQRYCEILSPSPINISKMLFRSFQNTEI